MSLKRLCMGKMLVSIEIDSIQKSNEQNKSAWLWIIAALDEFEDTTYGENDGFHWTKNLSFTKSACLSTWITMITVVPLGCL